MLLRGLSLVVASGGHCLVAMRGSHCGDVSRGGAQALGYAGFSSCGSRALEHRLNSYGPRPWLLRGIWDLPRSGSNLCLLPWQTDFLPLSPQGSLQLKKKKKSYWTQTKGGNINQEVEDSKYTFLIFPSKPTERNLPSSHSRPHPRKH